MNRRDLSIGVGVGVGVGAPFEASATWASWQSVWPYVRDAVIRYGKYCNRRLHKRKGDKRREEIRQMIRDQRLPAEAFQSPDELSPPEDVFPAPFVHVVRQQAGGKCLVSNKRRAERGACRPLKSEIGDLHSSALDSAIVIEYSTELLSRSIGFLGLSPEEGGALIAAISEAINQAGGPAAETHAVQAAIDAAVSHLRVPGPGRIFAEEFQGITLEGVAGAAVVAVQTLEDPRPTLRNITRGAGLEASPEDLETVINDIKNSKNPKGGSSSESERAWDAAHDFFWMKMTQTTTGKTQMAKIVALQTARLAAYSRKLHSELCYLGWYTMLKRPAKETYGAYSKGPPPPVHPPSTAWEGITIEQPSKELRAAYNYEKQNDLDINVVKDDQLTNCTTDRSGWVYGTNTRGYTGYFPYNRLGSVKHYDEPPTARHDGLQRRRYQGQRTQRM